MKTWVRMICFGVLASMLVACASSSPYKPAKSGTSTGYSERQIADDRWRVIFRMRNDNLAAAQDFALLRAAELTLQQGFEWFEVVDRNSDADDQSRGNFTVGFGLSGCGYYGCGSRLGVGTDGSRPRSLSILEVRMGKDAVPEGSKFYDARQLVATLRPSMVGS